MKTNHRGIHSIIALAVLFSLTTIPGCLTGSPPDTDLSESELADLFLSQADLIREYRSEYSVSSGISEDNEPVIRIRYDYKSPSFARMEIIESGTRAAGTFATTNSTSTAWYDAATKTYDYSSRTNLAREYDYQSMVRQIVGDRNFTIIGQDTGDGRTRYLIEVVTSPWSDRYTPYISSRVRAWIEPSTGLAWVIMTYYDCDAALPTLPPGSVPTPTPTPPPSDAVPGGICDPTDIPNRVILYESILVNSGIPDSHFEFTPPEGSSPRCVPKYVNYVEPPRTDTSVPINQPLPGLRYSLNESDSGREVTAGPGDVIEISLRTAPGLAFRWIMPSEGECLELMNAGSFFETPENGDLLFGPGYYRWRFRAISTGTQVFDGIYALDGCDVQNVKRFNLTVIVVENG